jgi:hypothetical protein
VAELRIPGDGSDGVTIAIPERDQCDARSEGWLDAEVWVKLGTLSGRYSAQFHEDDFSPFAEKLGELHTTLKGDATLSSLDGYLDLTLTGDGLGHISVVGETVGPPEGCVSLGRLVRHGPDGVARASYCPCVSGCLPGSKPIMSVPSRSATHPRNVQVPPQPSMA